MSYFDYPRLHFSGKFKASPSTINNTPNNYDPLVYPTPDELQNVELYWNPKGDGGFEFSECVVTQVDYADGTSATTPAEDSMIGQPVECVKNPEFPLGAALVDLDPMQQNVSEIWAMTVQIGGANNLTGKFAAISFYAIWGQAQGANAPRSSASGSGVYQSTLMSLQLNGSSGNSRFLQHFEKNPGTDLSLNFNLNTHNNNPPIWRFNADTFAAMRYEEPVVPEPVLEKIAPMQTLVQNLGPDWQTSSNSPRGDVPTQDFVLFMLQQYLTTAEYNANIETIMAKTQQPYTGSTTEDFLYGLTCGTAGPACEAEPTFFVANRMMNPVQGSPAYFAPFVLSNGGKTICLNLGNSLPTELPGQTPWASKLGQMWLVAFPIGEEASTENAKRIAQIPYGAELMKQSAGFFTADLGSDHSAIPLGLLSVFEDGNPESILLAEDQNGYYLRADQFVFRMNPGIPTTPENPRGETATVEIHALKFGQPVDDGTGITLSLMNSFEAQKYTAATLGTSGTNGLENLSIPPDALKVNNQPHQPGSSYTVDAKTKGGVAAFDLSCTAPGNPRRYVDGQIYLLNYSFTDSDISGTYTQDANDLISIQVYDELAEDSGVDILGKFGRLYAIMNFLTDEEKISQIDLRNMIKLLLEKPFGELQHMPVTRDISDAARDKVIAWINELNQS